ncbi:MAG: GNAT family N-acetyltransferase [Prevotellaceae bacterium]|jgi:predicted acetyltransferase|nr:GNAT family N-acetyltransferase [Prevotellaceae bacterium]
MNHNDINIDLEKQRQSKKLATSLYKLCFDDNDQFVDFYFNKRYTEQNHFTVLENNTLVAALQVIPYKMTFFDAEIDTAYLSAICTHPNFRKQGFMTKLLKKTYNHLFGNGIYAAFLIPADLYLFDIYKKNDFKTIFYRTQKHINTRSFNISNRYKIYEYSEENKSSAFEYFTRKMSERKCCIQHSFSDFETVCEDIYNSGGTTLIAENASKIAGISFASPINAGFAIIEHFAETQEVSDTLLKTISERIGSNDLIYIDIPQKKHCRAFGMMRIICVEKMLQLYAKTHSNLIKTIFVKDDVITENSGCYTILNSKCIKFPLENTRVAWNIAQLTEFVFDGQTPYMSLMLNE